MKAAHELAATVAGQSDSRKPSSDTPMLERKWVAALFLKMQAVYGHRWTVSFEGIEETAMREWAMGLAGLTAEQIRRGLDSLNSEWPPTLPQFKALCLGRGKNEYGLDYVPQYYRETRHSRMLDKPRNDESAKQHLSAMRAKLRVPA